MSILCRSSCHLTIQVRLDYLAPLKLGWKRTVLERHPACRGIGLQFLRLMVTDCHQIREGIVPWLHWHTGILGQGKLTIRQTAMAP